MRLQWWGLYHDKPKIGTFMLRVKVPAGQLAPRRAARDRRGLQPLRPRRRRALDAPEHPAPLARARAACPTSSRDLERRRRHDRGRLRRHRPQHHRLPRAGASPPTSSSTRRRSSTRRPTSSTATPTGRTCRASTSTRSPPAPTAATRPRSTASRSIGTAARRRRGLRGARRRRSLLGAAPRHASSASSCPRRRRTRSSAAITSRLVGGPHATASRA